MGFHSVRSGSSINGKCLSAMRSSKQRLTLCAVRDIRRTHHILNGDECVRALSAALEATDAELHDDVSNALLRLIAEFVPFRTCVPPLVPFGNCAAWRSS